MRRLGVPLVQGYFLARPAPAWPALDPGARAALHVQPIHGLLAAEAAAFEVFQTA